MKHLNANSHLARPFVAALAFLCSTCALADNISGDQALQLARQFVTHRAPASGQRHAPAAMQQVTPAGQVSGLYVFNVGSDGGFVIVSNDDRTTPVLGFSDSGHLDTQNIPSNMRAWLQGYADEIAWLQKQEVQLTPSVRKAPKAKRAPQLIDNHVAVAPMLKTTWSQNRPYNDQAPYYKQEAADGPVTYSKDYVDGYQHCVTGCVATAMAQVMKYHQWPTGQTTNIPAYTWPSAGIGLDGLSPVTFSWSNMLNSYAGSYTTAQSEAVSTLMKYCGWSVGMDYGPSSGSNTDAVATALVQYFGYNRSTTQTVARTFYTYADWMALIYHEVYNGRPVVYGGQSSGGGHEFVCDGYEYENATDFFHINWGWGGLSDDYFVLSVLKPNLEGIGGSSTNDGYRSGQDAVIGIQKPNESGTVADIAQKEINLVLNSMTLDQTTIYLGSSVNVTLNVTNNSGDDFEGTVCLGRLLNNSGSILAGGNIAIPAGGTSDCVITYTPTEQGTYDLVFFTPSSLNTYYTDGTVYASFNVLEQGLPYDLAATDITHNSALVSWTSNATGFDLRYGIIPEGYSTTPTQWLQYDNGTSAGAIGTDNSRKWTWGVMYPGENITGGRLTKVSFYENSYFTGDVNITIYGGGDEAPGTQLYEETVTGQGGGTFHEVALATPVDLTPGQNLWITLTVEGTRVLCVCSSNEPNNQRLYNGGWMKLGDIGQGAYGWLIRGCIESQSIDEINDQWPVVSCTSPADRTGPRNEICRADTRP